MANEALKVELTNETGFPRRFTVASGVAIAKGSLLKLTDDRTAIIHSARGDYIAGIASMDKAATDYSTSISAWTDGIFTMLASGAITTGEAVQAGHVVNSVSLAVLPVASGSAVIGYAMQDFIDGATGDIRVRL